MNNMDGPPQAAAKQPSPARALLAAVTRRAGRVIGLTPPRLPTTVGESPFAQSVAGSSIRSPAYGAAAANGAGDVNVDAGNVNPRRSISTTKKLRQTARDQSLPASIIQLLL